MRTFVYRTGRIKLSCGTVLLEFWQDLDTTEEYTVEFSIPISIQKLTKADFKKIKQFGVKQAKLCKSKWE